MMLLVLWAAAPARADQSAVATAAPGLSVNWAVDGAVTGGTLAAWLGTELAKESIAPSACRWCSAGGFDTSARDALRWGDTAAAATTSDVMVLTVPAGVLIYDALASKVTNDFHPFAEDALVIVESVAVAGALTQAAKFLAARQRPYAVYGPGTGSRDDHLSFWSSHASIAFSAAAAGGTVAMFRGYTGWPWVYGAGLAGAAATGYFRIAADKHWLTDVLAGAAAGTGVGLGVTWLHRGGATPTTLRVLPAPGGLTIAGRF